MSETESPYFKVEKQSPINKASAMIDDYLDLAYKRRENGELLDKLHERDLEIKELRAKTEE